jgi:hypothetical protein
MDLEFLAGRYNTTISMIIRAFLQRCVDEAMDKIENDEQANKMG